MRLRLQTTNVELPHLKAWFSFTEDSQPKLIADLKKLICTTIKSFSNASVSFRDIDLELDGFELLNELSTEGTLRDGDLLAIKRREEVGKKRKADDDDSGVPSKRPRRSKPRLLVSTTSSSSSSSSSSESEIESSASESESDSTDSDSDSDSDSSESSALNPNDSRKHSTIPRPPKPLPIKPTAPVQQDHVPPGFGSIKTRKRNIRRRLKKKHEAPKVQGAADTVPSPPKRISIANIAPLGFKSNVSAATVTTAQQSSGIHLINDPLNLTMFSLGNKNKKKGYKYALAPPTTQKKVFTELESYNVSSSSALQGEAEADSDALNNPFPPSITIFTSAPENPSTTSRKRVIPPFELQSLGKLPKNMFVTSVDVEEDLWRNSLSKKKKKQRHDQWDENYVDPVSAVPQDGEDMGIDLDYGLNEGEPAVSHSLSGPDANDFDAEDSKSTLIWSVVENDFETYPQATLGSLQNGKLVAWKALALNPDNYSPEVLLHIATVTAVSAASSGEMPSFSIRRLIRPGWEDLDVEDVEGIYGWESVNQMGWKAVNEIKRL